MLLYSWNNYNFTFCVILFCLEFYCNFFIEYSKFSTVLHVNNEPPHNPISDLLTSWHFCVHIGLTGMRYAIFYTFLSIEEQRSNPFCHLKLITVCRLLVCIFYLADLTWVCTIKYKYNLKVKRKGRIMKWECIFPQFFITNANGIYCFSFHTFHRTKPAARSLCLLYIP